MPENNTPENTPAKEPSLREAAMAVLAANGAGSYPVMEKIMAFGDSYSNDLVYAMILEMEVTHRMIEQLSVKQQQQNQVLMARLTENLAAWQNRLQQDMIRRDLISRSQFRRLVAIHRERFLTRTVIFTAVGLFALLAGLGIYYLYRLIGG